VSRCDLLIQLIHVRNAVYMCNLLLLSYVRIKLWWWWWWWWWWFCV